MKFKPLTPLKQLKRLNGIDRYQKLNKSYLSQIELILYSSNLCLFSMRILRDEIQVPNRGETLSRVSDEVEKLYNLLSKDNYYLHSNYTKQDVKEKFKEFGIKKKHLEH